MIGQQERPRLAAAWLAAMLVVAAPGVARAAAAASPEAPTVVLSAEEQARLGVSTAMLAAAAAPSGATSTARVLDPAPLIQLDAELAAATASAAASRAEAQRTRQLFAEDRTASRHAVETAEAQETADLERLRSAERRLLVEWGEGIAQLSGHQRAALLDELARLRVELVRVELPAQVPNPARGSAVELFAGGESPGRQGQVLGLLPSADPRLQTRGVLVELRGAQANLGVGALLTARLPAEARAARGVLVPRGALLRRDSHVWVYVQTAPTRFTRREISDYQPLAAGWFVARGLAAGERVVESGAEVLLGVESTAAGSGTD